MCKVKVCHLTSVHPLFDIRIFQKECKALAAAGYDVTFVAPCECDEIVDGIKIRAVPKFHSRFSRFTRTVLAVYLRAVEEQADIYHIHDPELIPVALLLKLQGKKIVYDVHEDVPRQNLSREWLPVWLRVPLAYVTEFAENIAVRAFDEVVGATPLISQRFEALGVNVININNYPPKQGMVIACAKSKPLKVCYAGAIAFQRGIREMVQAIVKTDCQLALVGELGPGPMLDELEKTAGWENVILKGYIPHKEVPGFLADCLAGLVIFYPEPNHVNSQPTKMYEYMAAGLPVIASNFPYWREIIEGLECGLCVDPLIPDELAAAIQWMVNHPDEAKRMGERGRLAVEKKFNWSVEEKKLLALYGRLTEGLMPKKSKEIYKSNME